MTVKRLSELKDKFKSGNGTTEDLGEILTDLFQSVSDHMKEVKANINEIKENQSLLYQEIDSIKSSLNPVYTIIREEDD